MESTATVGMIGEPPARRRHGADHGEGLASVGRDRITDEGRLRGRDSHPGHEDEPVRSHGQAGVVFEQQRRRLRDGGITGGAAAGRAGAGATAGAASTSGARRRGDEHHSPSSPAPRRGRRGRAAGAAADASRDGPAFGPERDHAAARGGGEREEQRGEAVRLHPPEWPAIVRSVTAPHFCVRAHEARTRAAWMESGASARKSAASRRASSSRPTAQSATMWAARRSSRRTPLA